MKNILVILSDEQRADTLGCYGNPVARTPHIDGLAKRGTVLTNCFTTFPLCCPARAGLLTGMMPHNHHVVGNWRALRPDLRDDTIVRDFRNAGYHMIYSGKWHVPGTDPRRMGFHDVSAIPAVVDGKDRGRYIAEYRSYVESRGYRLRPGHIENLTDNDFARLRDTSKGPYGTAEIPLEHFLETWQTEQFLGNLRERDAAKPFCAVVSYSSPHFPMIVPEPYDRIIDPETIPLPDNFGAALGGKPEEVRRLLAAQAMGGLSETEWRRLIAHYYGLCSLVDEQVGKILKFLETEGLRDETLIVYSTDHGDMMGSHGLNKKGHQMHYEETNRIPMIVSDPGGAAGRRSDGLVSLIDLLPTLAEICGVEVDRKLDGVSCASLLSGDTQGSRGCVISESYLVGGEPGGDGGYYDPEHFDPNTDAINMSVRSRSAKYIYHSNDIDEYYDLAEDPYEMENLIGKPRIVEEKKAFQESLVKNLESGSPVLADTVRRMMAEK